MLLRHDGCKLRTKKLKKYSQKLQQLWQERINRCPDFFVKANKFNF